jgi:hypothetical protein
MSYIVTVSKIKKTFNKYNLAYFDNKLKLPVDIDIDYMDNEWAAYIPFDIDCAHDTLYINNLFSDKTQFKNTIAHEMVHMWQWQVNNNENCGHNDDFLDWYKKLSHYGIDITCC